MNTQQGVQADERTMAVAYQANTWGFNFIAFGLLIDVMYRGAFLDEAAWDLMALVIGGGAISTVHLARHKVLGQVFGLGQVFHWRALLVFSMAAVIVAIVTAAVVSGRGM